jgi:hypothetical protein
MLQMSSLFLCVCVIRTRTDRYRSVVRPFHDGFLLFVPKCFFGPSLSTTATWVRGMYQEWRIWTTVSMPAAVAVVGLYVCVCGRAGGWYLCWCVCVCVCSPQISMLSIPSLATVCVVRQVTLASFVVVLSSVLRSQCFQRR